MGTARKLYFENVRVGEELPPLVKPTVDRVAIARYTGAIEDFNRLYVDEDFAKRSGFPTVCVPGSMAMGFLGQLVADWFKPGQVKRLSARFVKIIWPGDSLVCRGRIVDKRREGPENYVDLEVWVENQRGELVVKGTTTSRIFFSPSDEERHRRGLQAEPHAEASRPSLVDVLEREMPSAVVEAKPRSTKARKGGAQPPAKREPARAAKK